jgi:hypothetical protein
MGKIKAINKQHSGCGLKNFLRKFDKPPAFCFNISNVALTQFEKDSAL